MSSARFLPRWEVGEITGAVVAVDVIRAFTTAAYAFGAGARQIFLVDSLDEALAMKAGDSSLLAMGENRGRRPEGFDFSNSPVHVASADLTGRSLVQRTSAGTRGVVAARAATRLWAASLVCASATAAAVTKSGLDAPTYVITGRVPDAEIVRPSSGSDDLAAAELIERARLGADLDIERTVSFLLGSDEATRMLALGPDHAHTDDIAFATRVDAFDFAMEVERVGGLLRLTANRM